MLMHWNFDNSYVRLPALLFRRQAPIPVSSPALVIFNDGLAATLGLTGQKLSSAAIATYFSGNQIPEGADPIAQAYAGHQFGHFTVLGDGRALLLGEHITPHGQRVDIQLKGSGQTPFSRRGDGRAALGPMLREYLISEAMHALGIPTTRSLSVVTTGESVLRETVLPGAILTRVAASHLRVGTFEYIATHGDPQLLKTLADYTIQRHYPEIIATDQPYLALLEGIMERQAALIAQWLQVGFIHGVMNTDNMALSGETLDYGPCAFMDTYHPATVFSSIDHAGRYAYGNQPHIAQWNLARFAETLLPLLHKQHTVALSLAQSTLESFAARFERYWLTGMCSKLGLLTAEPDDKKLIVGLLDGMQQKRMDYTNTFITLTNSLVENTNAFHDADFQVWQEHWHARLKQQAASQQDVIRQMRAHNPMVIPRNYFVEEALDAAVNTGDLSMMHRLLHALSKPYEDLPTFADYRIPPPAPGQIYQTFCGT